MQSPIRNEVLHEDLLTKSYSYELPPELIAQRPVSERHNSRLLVYDEASDSVTHTTFKNVHEFLPENSLLVLNESKVFPCRLHGNKSTGGKAEVMFLSLKQKAGLYPAMLRSRGTKKTHDTYRFGELVLEIKEACEDGTFWIKTNFEGQALLDYLNHNASIPIPPYIREGQSDEADREDYQTTFAQKLGSVAAPTAGLHFTEHVFESFEKKKIDRAQVTLHVGAGTFRPVMSDKLTEHKMHHEYFEIERTALEKLNRADFICAVGTTCLRALESSYQAGEFHCTALGSTDIFLYPGKEVRSVNALITNFHLSESTLLMLVAALIGRRKTLELYELALRERYRFYSYGDAMLILRKKK